MPGTNYTEGPLTRHRLHRVPPDPRGSDRFVVRTCLTWAHRLLDRGPGLDEALCDFVCWLLDDALDPLLRPGGDGAGGKQAQTGAGDRAAALKRLADSDPSLVPRLLALVRARNEALAVKEHSLLQRNVAAAGRELALGETERKLLLMSYLAATCPPAATLVQSLMGVTVHDTHRALAVLLGSRVDHVGTALEGTFRTMGLVARPHESLALDYRFLTVLERSPSAFLQLACLREITSAPPKVDCTGLDLDLLAGAVRLLRNGLMLRGVHVLIHGPGQSGKTTLARSLACDAGVRAFAVTGAALHDPDRLRQAVDDYRHLTCNMKGAVLVVSPADLLLRQGADAFSDPDTAWLSALLGRAWTRVVWVVEQVSDIPRSLRRRFTVSLELPDAARRRRLRRHQKDTQAKNQRGVQADVHGLSEEAELNAVCAAIEAAGPGGDVQAMLDKLMLARQTLINGGVRGRRVPRVSEEFTLEGLNVRGDLTGAMHHVGDFDQHMRSGDRGGPAALTMLLHGPPGTGKTELARHIAQRLDRPLMVRQYADLVSKWVGDTEKAIARAFELAEDTEAVLVIDEADALLFPRERSCRSFEVGQTTQVLTSLDLFRGIVVFTTNRVKELDRAALRRFNVKLELDYLTDEGKVLLYERYLKPIALCEMSAGERKTLARITRLAPGDFRVVRDRFCLGVPWERDTRLLLDALAQESALKGDGGARPAIGFGTHDRDLLLEENNAGQRKFSPISSAGSDV